MRHGALCPADICAPQWLVSGESARGSLVISQSSPRTTELGEVGAGNRFGVPRLWGQGPQSSVTVEGWEKTGQKRRRSETLCFLGLVIATVVVVGESLDQIDSRAPGWELTFPQRKAISSMGPIYLFPEAGRKQQNHQVTPHCG